MRKYFYIFILLWLAFNCESQTNSKRDKIEELRVSFITQNVNLTSQESQQFWPLYNEFNDKLDNLKKK